MRRSNHSNQSELKPQWVILPLRHKWVASMEVPVFLLFLSAICIGVMGESSDPFLSKNMKRIRPPAPCRCLFSRISHVFTLTWVAICEIKFDRYFWSFELHFFLGGVSAPLWRRGPFCFCSKQCPRIHSKWNQDFGLLQVKVWITFLFKISWYA